MFTDSANSPRVSINGFLAFALKFEHSQVMLIEFGNDNLKLTTCDNRILTTLSYGYNPG